MSIIKKTVLAGTLAATALVTTAATATPAAARDPCGWMPHSMPPTAVTSRC